MRKDPLRRMYVHVGLVVSLTLLALGFAVIYVVSPPGPPVTGMVLVEYPELHLGQGFESFVDAVNASPDKQFIMLSFYAIWVLVVGVIAMAVHEYRRKRL